MAFCAAVGAWAICVPSAQAVLPSDPAAAQQEPLAIIELSAAIDHLARVPVDVPVLVPDTGLDLDHPDLASRLFTLPASKPAPCQAEYAFPGGCAAAPPVPAGANGWDMIGLDRNNCANGDYASAEVPDADPDDPPGCSGHGTAVSGVLGAAWNNGQGGAGVAPNARFIAMRTCWDGDNCYGHVQPHAIKWAVELGARVVSLSWLGGPNPDLEAAIANSPNTLFVTIPSGNGSAYDADPTDPQPCALDLPNVLCVSTSAPDGGLDCGAFGPNVVDIAAPTRNSLTTVIGGGFSGTSCATSYASPTAAGVATLLFGLVPEATPPQVRKAIIDGATPSAVWQGKSVSGGILNARGAVDHLQALFGLQPPGDVLALVASAKDRMPGDKLRVMVTCSLACDVVAKASGKAGKKFNSKIAKASLPAGVSTKLRLELSARAERKIEGEKGRATINVTATAAGQTVSDAEPVKLKP